MITYSFIPCFLPTELACNFKLFQFNDGEIVATTGPEGLTRSGTLLGRLEDGRIIISQSGEQVAMVMGFH